MGVGAGADMGYRLVLSNSGLLILNLSRRTRSNALRLFQKYNFALDAVRWVEETRCAAGPRNLTPCPWIQDPNSRSGRRTQRSGGEVRRLTQLARRGRE